MSAYMDKIAATADATAAELRRTVSVVDRIACELDEAGLRTQGSTLRRVALALIALESEQIQIAQDNAETTLPGDDGPPPTRSVRHTTGKLKTQK